MSSYEFHSHKRQWGKLLLIVFVVLAVIGVGATISARHFYGLNLKPVSDSRRPITITIPRGALVSDTAKILKDHGLIRNEWVFRQFVLGKGLENDIKAGTYELQPSQSVEEIVSVITHGMISTDMVTILPGQRLDQIKKAFIETYGFESAAVEQAMNPVLYEDHPALVDKPLGASLEGYLFPESFQKTAETTPKDIIHASLDEMADVLTPEIRAGISAQGLNIYAGITLASIIEREVGDADPVKDLEDKQKVAQVFLKRLRQDIPLQSDATASYGAVIAGRDVATMPKPEVLQFTSSYNTYLNKGLTPSPVSNVSLNALKAVAQPANTDFLYFLSGDDCKTYFGMTLAEHEANINSQLHEGCGS